MNPSSKKGDTMKDNANLKWPVKTSPVEAAGTLGPCMGTDTVPDCEMCRRTLVPSCSGYTPLKPGAAVPPCQTYDTYTDYLERSKHGET